MSHDPTTCNPALFSVLDISTLHIDEEDSRNIGDSRLIADEFENGWWICVPPDVAEIDDIVTASGLSTALRNILVLALRHSCPWILLTGDGPHYTDLPKFDW